MMRDEPRSEHRYLPLSSRDEAWGLCCTTTGCQHVPPGARYPVSEHPAPYHFESGRGRVLDEYQLVYVTAGTGWLESESVPRTAVRAGTVIVLFPSERHAYAPDPATGWTERWVGFRGGYADSLVRNGFLSPSQPLYAVGSSERIERCYREIAEAVEAERAGFQQLVSGIAVHLLGAVLFEHANRPGAGDRVVEKIDRAKKMLRESVGTDLSPERIAAELGMGYTHFRRAFRQYAGMAPAQYRQGVRLNEAREMLRVTSYTLAEIARRLGFESASAFSLFFRSREGVSPSAYRRTYRGEAAGRRQID